MGKYINLDPVRERMETRNSAMNMLSREISVREEELTRLRKHLETLQQEQQDDADFIESVLLAKGVYR